MKKEHFILSLIAVAALSRLIPHPANFTAMGAIALFSGSKILKDWKAFLIPVAALWLSDLAINNILYAQYYESFMFFTDGFIYMASALLLAVIIGRFLLQAPSLMKFVGASLGSSVLFFLISNFGVWISVSSPYTANITGLLLCYEAAVPFFRNEFVSTLLFSGVLFGAYELAQRQNLIFARA